MRMQLKQMKAEKQQIYSMNMVLALLDLLSKAKRSLSRNSRKDITVNSSNYFTGLDDIPLHNWMKCMEGEINFVRKAENGTNEDDIKAWE